MMLKKAIVTVLFFLLVVSPSSTVFAQEAESTAEAEVTNTKVFTKDRETEKITQLRTLYRNQVEVYRNAEKAFIIAKTNHQQVQTLAALEEAVKATKLVMQERSKVMVTYLELLDAVLIETNGIELDLKDQSHTELIGLINAIKIHQDEINVSNDRASMAVLADAFEPIAFSYRSGVYKALSLVRIGQIQEVRDKSEIIYDDIVERHDSEEDAGSSVAKRKRAYVEIERNFDTVNENLTDLNEKFLEARRNGFTRQFFENILEDLGPVYAQISKSLDHVEELLSL